MTGKQGAYHPQPLNLHKEALGTVAMAAEARARMRNGDCAGALDFFDQALVSSIDPTLYRDRGLCHEKLGDPYPAIDDFRQYLTGAADAADSDDIRQRLARIEMDVYHHSSASTDAPATDTPAEAKPEDGEGAAPSVAADGEERPKRDEMEDVEHDHDELQSSLRAGRGRIARAVFRGAQVAGARELVRRLDYVVRGVRSAGALLARDAERARRAGRLRELQLDRRREHLGADVARGLRTEAAARRTLQ